MKRYVQNAARVALGLLALAGACRAQTQFGNFQLMGNANLNGGYNAAYGDQVQSNHGFQAGGSAQIDGSYYSPKFLSFDVRPFYNRSTTNSDFNSIFNSSGVTATTNIFGGSHFPGSVGFSNFYNKQNTFGLANGPELTTNGNGRGLNISWSELIPGLPTFTVAFTEGWGTGKVLGTNEESNNQSKNLLFRSTYTIKGFRLLSSYQRNNLHATTPGFFIGESEINTSGKNDLFNVQATHSLPLHGSFYTNYSKTHFENFFNGQSEGKDTVNTVDGGAFFAPMPKLSLSTFGSYSDSLYGVLNQAVAANGAVTPLVFLGTSSRTYSTSATASYTILNGLYAAANIVHVGQHYFGQDHSSTYFSGTLYGNYQKPLFGIINWSVAVVDNATEQGNSNVGLNTMVSASRRIQRWELSGEFAYQQNTQTILVGYSQSDYRWGGRVGRRNDRLFWAVGAGGMQTLLTQVRGNDNRSEHFFGTLGNGHYSGTFTYSQSNGISVLTSNGLQNVPIVPVVSPAQALILFNAHSLGFTATATPRRTLRMWTTYARSTSATASTATNSNNFTALYNANIEYQARRVTLTAGYNHFSQSVGAAAGILPAHVNSYWVGVNRWFNFF